MSNFLTQGRQTLLAELQADATLDDEVTTWFDWGAGIRKRYNLEPATCPLVSVVPADLESDSGEDTNVLDAYPQMVEVGVATAGQNAEPCENLVVTCLDVIRAADRDCMGLAEDGLNSVRLVDAAFAAKPKEEGKRIVWLAALTCRLAWRL